ncbi:hypothetical protein Aperf_G00000115447 [Anoplocephala perfoliata]
MGRRKKKSVTNRNQQNTSTALDHSKPEAEQKSTTIENPTSDEIELTLFKTIEDIRAHQLNFDFSASRTLGLVYPDWPPCPRYRLQPRGLVNSRNTCYILASIQSLLSLPPFTALLHRISVSIHWLFGHPGQLRDIWKASDATTVPLLRLFLLLLDEKTPYNPDAEEDVGPPDISHEYGCLSTQRALQLDPQFFSQLTFEPGHQQDAGDCLSRLITQLHEEMATLLRKFKPTDALVSEAPGEEDGDGWFTVSTAGKKIKEAKEARVDNGEVTPISLLFGGTLVMRSSYGKSPSFGEKSDLGMKERFFVLPLELRDGQISRLEDCFKFLSRGEILTDFRHPETGQCVVMNRRVFIDHLPPVLMLQLNRFFYSSDLNQIQKVLKSIPINRRLTIGADITSKEHTFSKAQGSYELKAVIFHIGYTAERGHYTVATLASESLGGEVLYFDDTNVFQFGEQTESCWSNLFLSHRPFDVRGGQFRHLKSQPQQNGLQTGPGLNIGEQPRTPYILIYTSRFQQRKT